MAYKITLGEKYYTKSGSNFSNLVTEAKFVFNKRARQWMQLLYLSLRYYDKKFVCYLIRAFI